MDYKVIVLVLLIKVVTGRIEIDINVDEDEKVNISYSGSELDLISDNDINLFKVQRLHNAVKQHLGKEPKDVYLRSPTPWGDLYKTYSWQPVMRVLSIKSARVTRISMEPVIVLSHDFENLSNQTVKVNTGITQSVENTLTTSWSKEKEYTVSQEIEYEFNVGFSKAKGVTGFSFANRWGVSEEKSKTQTIGSSSGMETELKPGQAVTAVLSAKAGFLEVEVIHKASLVGNLAVNYKRPYRGHHFWGPLIQDVMKSGNMDNEKTITERIKFGFHVHAFLKVYDKETGLPV
ncbi:spherulin-2A-like [Spodoptera litura]|uniref:Spherulin-2A-like n=1 Tax=Spodoptera litura TaxID=69820 RepID=A0A9J7IXH3_SPOLT|nr:spherulin-2A-like [Spodoptera litura]